MQINSNKMQTKNSNQENLSSQNKASIDNSFIGQNQIPLTGETHQYQSGKMLQSTPNLQD